MGRGALVISGNQASSDDVEAMFRQVRDHYGRLDIMINSVAIFKRNNLLDISESE